MVKVIDAKGLILGRMCTNIAKNLLLGETIHIINCSQAVITGQKRVILAKHKQRRARGQPTQGPFIPRGPDRFVKRCIRGMLPYKKPKGRDAMKRLICHTRAPATVQGTPETINTASLAKSHASTYLTVAELCKELGAKL